MTSKKSRILLWIAFVVWFVAGAVYPHVFYLWNLPSVIVCWVGFFVAATLLSWAFFELTEKKKPFLFGVICGAGLVVLSFGLSTLLSVIYNGKMPRVCMGAVALVHILYVAAFFVLICRKTREKRLLTSILGGVMVICIVGVNIVGMILPRNFYTVAGSYAKAIWKAQKREEVALPREALAKTEPDYDKKIKLFVNIDEATQVPDYVAYLKTKSEITADDLAYYVKPYIGTQVTDIMFSICGQSSATKSEYLTWRGDKVKWTEENGKKVDYSHIAWWWYILQEKDIDPVPYWIDTCKENNIRPWLSFRMNDCHDSGEETSPLRGELFYTAQKNGWMIGKEYGYYHTCYNYKVPQIREIMLSYIREQTLRYDVYGIELDWLREIYCFNYLHENNDEIVGIMNDFMREVKGIAAEAKEKWGHDVKVNARLMRDVDQNKIFGFDVRTWVKEGLVDSVTVTPRFSSCDSGMDIKCWKEQFPTLEIHAGIETRVTSTGDIKEGVEASAEVARGYAAEYLDEGADAIYLFNYMAYPYSKRNEIIYKTCGDMTSVHAGTRRVVMTYQDIAPEGASRYQPLPVAALKNKPATLIQKTGFISEGASVNVYVGFANSKIDSSRVKVKINDEPAVFEGNATIYAENEQGGEDIPDGYVPEGSKVYLFRVEDSSKLGNAVAISVENGSLIPLIITYLEIEIVAQ